MMKFTRALTIVIALSCSNAMMAISKSVNVSRLYQQLDSLIEHQQSIIAAKEARIKQITDGMHGLHLSTEQEFEINNRLYDEYIAFKFDSALYYIMKNVEEPAIFGNVEMAAASNIRLAHILAVSGLFDKAEKMLASIHTDTLSADTRVAYYNQRAELNLYRSEMALYSPYFHEYTDSAQYYRQLLLQIAPKTSYDYIFNSATYTNEQGNSSKAIQQLEALLPTLQQGDRRYSIVTSTLAYFYSQENDAKMQEYYLLLSAISDMQGAILENNSLRELSAVLMQRGEYKKAYTYLSQASNDAKEYGSRLRSLQTARLAPLITKAYDQERTQAEHRTNLLLGMISIIALLLMGTVLYILSLVKKRRLDNEKISRMNEELTSHNKEMAALNNQMKEANSIKEEYLARFLELSSNLILRGEERSKQLNRLARDHKLEDLYAELKNHKPLNESIRLFHQNFDTAFLNIYPNFIKEINRLMTDDSQFETTDENNRLTTELRVLALIRLGITDNQKIAGILRSSITTIYTYRSKLKSRAKSKATFEDDVKKI